MKELGNIYLTWRQSKGKRRHKVGIIRRNKIDGVRFNYTISNIKAEEIGFIPYTDFPDLAKNYTENVLDIFGQRLTKPERKDIQKYYDFWEIQPEYKDDKYYLLAHTQGLLETDNFEFLADYFPVKGLSFISEICGLSHNKLAADIIAEGEKLTWQQEPHNKFDNKAVKVFKNNIPLGYVKTVHSGVFYKKGSKNLKIRVKSIDGNGYLNRVFIQITL
jgi:hypothetical protein